MGNGFDERTDGTEIPTLTGLDSSRGDYVQKLEEGLSRVAGLRRETARASERLFGEMHDRTLTALRGIEGVTVEAFPQKRSERDLGSGLAMETTEEMIMMAGVGVETSRKVEDIVRTNKRRYDESLRVLEDRQVAIDRAGQDFAGAIIGLTKVTPLADVDYSRPSIHFYIPREEGVYETHVLLGEGGPVLRPAVNPNLKADYFSDAKFLATFKGQALGINANAFLINNPSLTVPVEVLAYQGLVHCYVAALEEHREERDRKEKDMSPVEHLVESIRRGMKNLTL